MKVSLNWIREFAGIDDNNDLIVEKIGSQLGAVEEVVDLGKVYQGIYIVKVVESRPHPKADKLSLCKIDDARKVEAVNRDENGLVQVVCGAPNVRSGMYAVWVPPGVTVPATYKKDPIVLEAKEIRGEISNGMLASPRELGIGDSHEGLLELSDGVSVGQLFSDFYGLNDTVVDIENKMFTHRPDLFGQIGVAREVAGITGRAFKSPDWYLKVKDLNLTKGSRSLEVKNEIPDLVPRFMVQVINGVSVKPSSPKIQSYLARVGLRPINNVVDFTNYFMMLTAQPLHAYDLDKLKKLDNKDKATIVVRRPQPDEKVRLLNGKTIELGGSDIVIASATQAVGLGGVMGGGEVEVDASTKHIVLECANFDMYAIRRSSMEHGLFTDAVTRFNKGQSALQNDRILAEIVSRIIEAAGGEAEAPIDVQSTLPRQTELSVQSDFINKKLGLDLTADKMAELLKNVEFEVGINAAELSIKSPFWRTDIRTAEDIVEEIGRLYGYDNLVLNLPTRTIEATSKNEILGFKSQIRDLLVRAGSNEVLTYSFTNEVLFESVGQNKELAFQLANARSPELQYYRMSLLPSLLEKVHPNIKAGFQEFAIFEINKVHIKNVPDESEPDLPTECYSLGIVIAADSKLAGAEYSGAAYYMAKYYLDYLLYGLGVNYEIKACLNEPSADWEKQKLKPFETIRTASVEIDGEAVGFVGEPNSKVRHSLKLPNFTSMIELDLLKLLKHSKAIDYVKLSSYPFTEQDVCFRVPCELVYQDLVNLLNSEIQRLAGQYHTVLSPIDIFRREDDKSHKQITFRLRLSAYDKTLTTNEVSELVGSLGKAAAARFGAVII